MKVLPRKNLQVQNVTTAVMGGKKYRSGSISSLWQWPIKMCGEQQKNSKGTQRVVFHSPVIFHTSVILTFSRHMWLGNFLCLTWCIFVQQFLHIHVFVKSIFKSMYILPFTVCSSNDKFYYALCEEIFMNLPLDYNAPQLFCYKVQSFQSNSSSVLSPS